MIRSTTIISFCGALIYFCAFQLTPIGATHPVSGHDEAGLAKINTQKRYNHWYPSGAMPSKSRRALNAQVRYAEKRIPTGPIAIVNRCEKPVRIVTAYVPSNSIVMRLSGWRDLPASTYEKNIQETAKRAGQEWLKIVGAMLDESGNPKIWLTNSIGMRLQHEVGQAVYFYAETTSGLDWYWEGAKQMRFDNTNYGFRRAPADAYREDGSTVVTLQCD